MSSENPAESRSRSSAAFVPSDLTQDPARLFALRKSGVLDFPSEEALDRLARLAATLLRAPVSLVTVVGEDRQLLKGAVGLSEPWASRREMPLEYSYCCHALGSPEPLLIEDAREDPRVEHSPAVSENRSIAYAGVPLATDEGHVLGTLCVVDHQPREWSEEEVALLQDLAASVMTEIRLRREIAEREQAEQELRREALTFHSISEAVIFADPEGRIVDWNPAAERMFGYSREEVLGESTIILQADAGPEGVRPEMLRGLQAHGRWSSDLRYVHKDGTLGVCHTTVVPIRDDSGTLVGTVGVSLDITERKRVETELHEIQAHLRQIAESIREVFWLFSPDFSTTFYVNPAYERIFGLSMESLYQAPTSFLEVVHPADLQALLAGMEKVATEPQSLVFRIIRSDGQLRTLHARGAPIRDDQGEVVRIAGITEDVTEREEAREALRESEERFRQLAENIREVFWVYDLDKQRTTYTNPAFETMWGIPRDQLYAGSDAWIQSLHPDDRAHVLASNEQQNLGEGTDVEYRIVRPDGEVRQIWDRGYPVRDARGQVRRVVGIAEDITERKRTEERLRRRNGQIALLQAAAVAANEAETLEEALQEVIEYICAHTDFSLGHAYLPAEDGGLIASTIWYASEPGRYDQFRRATELRRLLAGEGLPGRVLEAAEPIWIHELAEDPGFTRGPVAEASGLHAGVGVPVLVGEEVVAVMEFFSAAAMQPDAPLLEALANVGIQLGRVVERGRAEEALIRSREVAEAANRAKSEFLSRMSHELRTPMNAILGFAQLLEMDLEKPDNQESVQQILRGGRHLLGLINEVLDIARIESGRMTVSSEPVRVQEVLEECLSLVAPLARGRRVRLPAELPVEVDVYIRADRQRLKQVLLNLLSNAIKYNREEGAVTLSCEREGEDRLRIQVRDTGRGIPPDRLADLFTPFDRLGVEREGVEGTGLGLALSRAIVEALDGSIGAESEPGKGSTFWIELPLAAQPAPEPELEGAPPASGGQAAVRVRKVLHIEDNPANLKLMERVLGQRSGVELISAIQGSLGLELALQHRPDLILLDLHLPDLSGEEVLQRLRASEQTAEVPVVVVSADAMPRQIERLRAAGAQEFLTKPFEVARLLEVIDQILQPEEGE